MAQDQVANVRFYVARALEVLIPMLKQAVVGEKVCNCRMDVAFLFCRGRANNSCPTVQIKPVLEALIGDNDRDVRFYAEKAVAACKKASAAVADSAPAAASAVSEAAPAAASAASSSSDSAPVTK